MNLIEGIQKEQNRVREVKKDYENLPNNTGVFGLIFINQALKDADDSIASGDVVAMLVAYNQLQEVES